MSGVIVAADPRWMDTLPRRVAPWEDEWLPGLLLRCDAVNVWPAGSTARLLSPGIGSQKLTRPDYFVTAPGLDLPRLAALLALPLARVEETTFRAALSRLRARDDGGDGDDSAAASSGHLLSPAYLFCVCPPCVAEQHLLARWLAFPLLGCCPRHGVRLRVRCRCGAVLQPFRYGSAPFACADCGRPWATLPAEPPPDEDAARERAVLSLYDVFLTGGTPALRDEARGLLRAELYARGWDHVPPVTIGDIAVPRTPAQASSVDEFVASLVMLDLPAARLQESGPEGCGQLRCRNRACPLFGVATFTNIHTAHSARGDPLSYCDECGARFVGERMSSAFDDCWSPGLRVPSPHAVARARMHLRLWRVRLEIVCHLLLLTDEPVTLARAFARAGIPRTPHLRAHRLGLVALVQHYAILQQWLPPRTAQTKARGLHRWRPTIRNATAGQRRRLPDRTYSEDLSDAQWARVQPIIVAATPPEIQPDVDRREIMNALLYILTAGCVWRMLPDDLPSYATVYAVVCAWHRGGAWATVVETLRRVVWLPDIMHEVIQAQQRWRWLWDPSSSG